MTPTGSEHVQYYPGKSQEATEGGAKSGADSTAPSPADPDLARIVAAWPALREPIRRAMLSLIETALPVEPGTPQNAAI
jgi:hypothetical protein